MWRAIQKLAKKQTGIDPTREAIFIACQEIVASVKTDLNISKKNQQQAIVDLVRQRLASERKPKEGDDLLKSFSGELSY